MTAMSKTKKRSIASAITLCAVLVLFIILRLLITSGIMNTYIADILNLVCINVIAVVSLNLVTGLLGQLVLGHAGFMLIGSYAAAMFTNAMAENGWSLYMSLPIGLLLAGVFSALIGLFIGLPALRLRGDYLAIITLGFGEIIRVIANNLTFTNGARGYYGFPTFSIKQSPSGMFDFLFLLAALTIAFSYTFGTSRHGRAVRSIREDEIAAESSGIRTTYYKLLTFTLSAFFAGIAGGLYAHQIGVIDPARFDFNRSVELLMMVVLGGMGSITGSVLSASVLTVLPEALRGFASYRMLIYSVVLVAVMLFRPTGLLGRRELSVISPFEKLRALSKTRKAKGGGKT